MAHPQPPVPPDQQSDVIRGASSPPDVHPQVKQDPSRDQSGVNQRETADGGMRHQNLDHAPGRQDR